MKLTIAIPTYNRNEILKKNLELLLPQLTSECKLLIIDNCSQVPVEETIKTILEKCPNANFQIVRNRYNIGLTANILRCFELCVDPWLWILGDDDVVKEGAVEQILADIDKYKEFTFINYAWDELSFSRKQNIITKGIDNFLDAFESIGIILFISSSIYNIKKVIQNLSFGYFFQTTYAPHLSMLLLSLGEEGYCLLSREQIVTNNGFNTSPMERWDQLFIYQITILLRLPLKGISIDKLKKKLTQLTRVWTISHLVYSLVYMGYAEKSTQRSNILYKEIVRDFFYLDRRIVSKIIRFIGYLIVKYPVLFLPALRYIYKFIKGREFAPIRNLRI